jgi:hypothetical protein
VVGKSPSHRNFVLWGHLKGHIYETSVETEEGLEARNLATCGTIKNRPRDLYRVCQNMVRRCNTCNEFGALHFEQLL